MLFAHIIIAISSLVVTGWAWLSPTKQKLNISYSLVALTFATGTYLVIIKPAHLVSACVSGLVYLGAVFTGILLARHKLAKEIN